MNSTSVHGVCSIGWEVACKGKAIASISGEEEVAAATCGRRAPAWVDIPIRFLGVPQVQQGMIV